VSSWPSPYHARYSETDSELLRRLHGDGHSAKFVGAMLSRTPNSVVSHASLLGLKFKRVKKHERRALYLRLDPDTERSLAVCANELGYPKSRLASIVLQIVVREKYLGALLRLGGPIDGKPDLNGLAPGT
jgi:hypothetical protein